MDQKTSVVASLKGRFANAPFVVLAGFAGLTVAEMTDFRRALRAGGLHVQVVKNTLGRRAVVETPSSVLGDRFVGNIAVVFSGEDPIASAKLLRDQLRDRPRIEVRCGCFEGAVLTPAEVAKVADLPSREQLLAQLLGVLVGGQRQILGVLQAPSRDLLGVLSNHAANLERAG
jgi:large subunit ribosomal protein L10